MKLTSLDQIKLLVSGILVALLLSILGGYELIQSYVIQTDYTLGYFEFHSLFTLQFTSSKVTYNQLDEKVSTTLDWLDGLYDRYEERVDEDNQLIQNLYQVNLSYGSGEWVQVPSELFDMLELSYRYTLETDGAYNMFIGSLVDVWRLYFELGVGRPTDQQINDAKMCVPSVDELTQYTLFEMNQENLSVRLNTLPTCTGDLGVRISLGGMAKGYAVQTIGDDIRSFNIPIFFSGGRSSVRLVGYDNLLFEGGLTNPLYEDDSSIGESNINLLVLDLIGDVGISSSGDYEQYTIEDNIRYHHIIDPSTGFSQDYFRNVTVIATDSVLADILSTALMVLPLDDGLKLVQFYRDNGHSLDVIWVGPSEDTDLVVYTSGHSLSTTRDCLFPIVDLS